VPTLGEDNPVLTAGLLCAAMFVGLVILVPVVIALERRRLRRARARFLRGRTALPDSAFLARVGVPAQQESFFLAARRAVAGLCDIPADMVHPDDSWRSLMDLQWDNGYLEDIVFALERELGRHLPFAYPADDRLPFVAYVGQLAECLGRVNPEASA
jgi:hypothetical protein